jgi:two-component system sensor histidine kinase HydH
VIVGEIRRMERCLRTFLDFARPPKLERTSFDIVEVVERVFALIAGRAEQQGVDLRVDRPATAVTVNADHEQLQQLLLNLALNALDAMPRGGTLTVAINPTLDGQAQLKVMDTGPGIAADLLPKVFEAFVTDKPTGVGLGLVVSRRIAENHGGTLVAYNMPEGGACFVLRLPGMAAHPRPAAAPESRKPAQTARNP